MTGLDLPTPRAHPTGALETGCRISCPTRILMIYPLAADLDHVLTCTEDIWESLRGQRLFMSGGTGFVGTWLSESLVWADSKLNLGVEAVLLTRDPERFAAKAPAVASHKSVRLLRGTVQEFVFPEGDFQFVIHAAAESATNPTPEHPLGSFDADLAATRRVLEFACSSDTHRLLFTSSGAVYGRQPRDLHGFSEEYTGAPQTTDENSAYGQAKRACEFLCTMYARQFGFDAMIARLFAFVGPHLPLERYAVGNFLRDAMNGRTISIESDGTTVRSYLYAADMAAWLWTIFLRGISAHPYNVGSSNAVTVRELAQAVAAATDHDVGIQVLGHPEVPATRYVPETWRAEDELGLAVHISLEEGLRRTAAWHRTQRGPLTR